MQNDLFLRSEIFRIKWFIYKYRRIKKEQRVSLGEEEMKYIRHAMTEVLMEEVRSLS